MANFMFGNKSIYYEEYGKGEPLILLNGIMMSCMSWAEFIEPFSAHNRLILVDFLDQGRSARMDDCVEYSQAIQVEVIYSLMKHLNLKKASIMGISYGGEVALRFAVKYQEKVEKLMLFNTTARTGEWLGDIGNSWIKAEYDPDAYYLTTIPIIYSPSFYKKNNEWMNNRRELLRPVFGNKDFISAMERLKNSSSDYDVSNQIEQIKVPALVVSCQQDYLTPIEEQQYIVSKLENCHYVIIPECGHASMYEQPVLFASLVIGFMNNSKLKFNIF